MKKILSPLLLLLVVVLILSACTETGELIENPIIKDFAASADGSMIAYSFYHKAGIASPDDVNLVFVHGWACDQTYWDDQVIGLITGYRITTIDLAGHGLSEEIRTDYTVDAFARDVEAVVEALELENVVLIGHSLGAAVVLEAKLLLQEKVIGIIGVDSYHYIGQIIPSIEEMEPYYLALQLDFAGTVAASLEQSYIQDEEIKARILEDTITPPPSEETAINSIRNFYIYNYELRAKDAFENITVPIRAINSAFSPSNVEAGQACTSSFEIYYMSDVGHYLMLEEPELFNKKMAEVLDEMLGNNE